MSNSVYRRNQPLVDKSRNLYECNRPTSSLTHAYGGERIGLNIRVQRYQFCSRYLPHIFAMIQGTLNTSQISRHMYCENSIAIRRATQGCDIPR